MYFFGHRGRVCLNVFSENMKKYIDYFANFRKLLHKKKIHNIGQKQFIT